MSKKLKFNFSFFLTTGSIFSLQKFLKQKIMALHKGTELNNVRETWQQNERNRDADDKPALSHSEAANTDLDRIVREEATAYDNADKEERLLGGERATVNDSKGGGSTDE